MREKYRLFRYLKKDSGLLIVLFLCTILFTASMLSIALVYKVGYDEYLPTGSGAALGKLLALVIGISALRLLSSGLMNRIIHVLRFKVRGALRSDLLGRLLDTQYSFFTEHDNGTLVNRLIPETDLASEVLIKVGEAALHLFQIIAFFTFLMFLDIRLGLFYLLLFSAALGLMFVMRRLIEKRQSSLSKTRDRLYGFFGAYFTSMKEIKCYNLFPLQKNMLRALMDEEGRHHSALTLSKSVLDLGAMLPVMLGMGFLFVWGFVQIVSGTYSYGSLLMMLFLLSVLYLPMVDFTNAVITVQMNQAALDKVCRLFDSPLEPPSGGPLAAPPRSIRLERLSFSYLPGREVLDNLRIGFPGNTFTVIVGESGSGKTTLVNLLLRLYPVPDGRILVDERDINLIGVRSLRENIGLVGQDFFMLDGSLRENIDVWARLSDGEVLELCRDVGLAPLVSALPAGIHTRLAEDGQSLSGGERQRVAVARCLAKKAHVMILDEATAALDLNTERRIIETLLEIRKKRNPFMIIGITHRPSFALFADRILVLDRGAVAEAGTHEELMSKKRKYFALFTTIKA